MMINLVDKIEESDKNYIIYPDGEKMDIMDVEGPLLIDQMHTIDINSNINLIKIKLVSDSNEIVKKLEEYRGPVKDCSVLISVDYKTLKKIRGPVWENIHNYHTGEDYIRYGRSVEFI